MDQDEEGGLESILSVMRISENPYNRPRELSDHAGVPERQKPPGPLLDEATQQLPIGQAGPIL